MKPPTIASRLSYVLIAVAMLIPATCYAGQQHTPLTVNVTVVPACSISVTSNIAFTYDFLNANTTTADGGVAISCEAGTYGNGYPAAHVNFGSGNTQSPDNCAICSFTMVGGGHGLGYNLSWDPNSIVTTYQLSQTQTAAMQPTDLVVYGSIPPGQNVPAGTYTDTVQVSVSF